MGGWGGGGLKKKCFLWGEVWIFSGTRKCWFAIIMASLISALLCQKSVRVHVTVKNTTDTLKALDINSVLFWSELYMSKS